MKTQQWEKGRVKSHQPGPGLELMAASQMYCICDNDMVIVGSLPFLSNIGVQRTIAEEEEERTKKNHFINPSAYYFCPFPAAAPEASQFYRWLLSISGFTEQQSERSWKKRHYSQERKICKVTQKKCQQGSSIRQSDMQLHLSLSLTNSRAVRYKLPCDSVGMTLGWEIWTRWRGVKRPSHTSHSPGLLLDSGQRVAMAAIRHLSEVYNTAPVEKVEAVGINTHSHKCHWCHVNIGIYSTKLSLKWSQEI